MWDDLQGALCSLEWKHDKHSWKVNIKKKKGRTDGWSPEVLGMTPYFKLWLGCVLCAWHVSLMCIFLWPYSGLTGGEPLTVPPSEVHQEAQADDGPSDTVFLKCSWTWEQANDDGSQITGGLVLSCYESLFCSGALSHSMWQIEGNNRCGASY